MDRENVNAPASAPKTTLEQVQRWALQGGEVTEAPFEVPGVELFRIADGKPARQDAYPTYLLVAIVGGPGHPILESDDAMRAVIQATQEPAKLAEIALAINRRPAMLLQGPKDGAQRKQGVSAPVLASGAVDFWIMTGSPGLTLMHGRLDLASGKLDLAEPTIETTSSSPARSQH